MSFINHFGIWLLLVFVGNVTELFNEHPFNNIHCNEWHIPTSAMTLAFLALEFLILIFQMIFIW